MTTPFFFGFRLWITDFLFSNNECAKYKCCLSLLLQVVWFFYRSPKPTSKKLCYDRLFLSFPCLRSLQKISVAAVFRHGRFPAARQSHDGIHCYPAEGKERRNGHAQCRFSTCTGTTVARWCFREGREDFRHWEQGYAIRCVIFWRVAERMGKNWHVFLVQKIICANDFCVGDGHQPT